VVTYEITAEVRDDLVPAYEEFMRGTHVPDLLATGYFVGASFSRSTVGRYRIRYEARNSASLERYLAEHAPRLRAHFDARFPEGVRLSRERWTVVQAWPAGSAGSVPTGDDV
jgi:hypothetical protein